VVSAAEIAGLLAEHQTHVTVMGGWSDRNGRDSDRRYGWSCSCREHSPSAFKVDLTQEETDAGRFAHVAAVLAEREAGVVQAAVDAKLGEAADAIENSPSLRCGHNISVVCSCVRCETAKGAARIVREVRATRSSESLGSGVEADTADRGGER
jgi:hypothetical protein